MAWHQTDCIQRPLSLLFEKFGRLVGSYPVWFLITPLILSICLSGGFYFLEARRNNDLEGQFTPSNGPSKEARAFVKEKFPYDDSMFSSQRRYAEGNYAILIVKSKNGANILRADSFKEIIDLDKKVTNISVSNGQTKLQYKDLCAKANGRCVSNALLDIINYNPSLIERTNITFPHHTFKSREVFLGASLGGVKQSGRSVQSAEAVKLVYFLEDIENSTTWLAKLQDDLSSYNEPCKTEVYYFTSRSRQDEIQQRTSDGVPLFSTTYALVIVFSVMSCLRLDNVRNKVWVALIGVLSAGLAVVSSFGLMLYINMPFVLTVANSPFLVLGIGVDDMFIMLSNWQQTCVKDPVEKRMADTYKEAAMSITVTTLTDIIGFYIGLMNDFPSVRTFCLYTSTAIIFCYIYNITFFGAFLALNGRRENSNRHWLTCRKIPDKTPPGSKERYNICCVGGGYDEKTGTEKEQPVKFFFKELFGPCLTNRWTKVFVIVLYMGYLAAGIYGCTQIQQGIDLRYLADDDSFVIDFYDNEEKYFSNYGPNVMVVVREEFPYWDKSKRSELEVCMDRLNKLSFTDADLFMSWLNSYVKFAEERKFSLDDERVFMLNLSSFFSLNPEFRQDVNIMDNTIKASRSFIQTVNVVDAEKKIYNELRETAKMCTAADLFVYHTIFIYYDQFNVIVSGTIQSIGFTAVVMLAVSLLLIPNPVCSLCVTLSIGSVITGVTGFMALWDVSLDSISMITLVISVGFTVDFSAHISYAFVSSKKRTANEKAIEALSVLGYPVLQGAVSTIVGVLILSTSTSYIFRTFFKIMFLVMILGLVHALVFIPVFLMLFLCCSNHGEKEPEISVSEFSPGQGPQIRRATIVHSKAIMYENHVFVNDDNQYTNYLITTNQTQIYMLHKDKSQRKWSQDPDCP